MRRLLLLGLFVGARVGVDVGGGDPILSTADLPRDPLTPRSFVGPLTVGKAGNEPIVQVRSDGTIFVSALHHLYRSTDGGKTFVEIFLPFPAFYHPTDSDLAIDPQGSVLVTFNWPYAGATGVCRSVDSGSTWSCSFLALPTPSDRPWIAVGGDEAYLVTNSALYETIYLKSTDKGATWIPREISKALYPQTGPLRIHPKNPSLTTQVVKAGSYLGLYLRPSLVLSNVVSTPLPSTYALPSGEYSLEGTFVTATEFLLPSGGRIPALAFTEDEGKSWSVRPVPVDRTTSIFTWATVQGSKGALLFYSTNATGDPSTFPENTLWDVLLVRTENFRSDPPLWETFVLEQGAHRGPLCIALSCSGNARVAGDFITATFDSSGSIHATWVRDGNPPEIRYAKVP